jgi:hypothetical protein
VACLPAARGTAIDVAIVDKNPVFVEVSIVPLTKNDLISDTHGDDPGSSLGGGRELRHEPQRHCQLIELEMRP